MAETITVRWAGPSDADSSSTYKVERTLDWETWTELAADQASTSPYVSVSGALDGDHSYGSTTIDLVSATSISSSGYGWIDDALVEWTGKSTNQLTGVTWHSGYGTYASGTTLYEAHESYEDTTTPENLAVVYRVTHTDAAGRLSAPAYFWFYYPDPPESSEHCVILVQVSTDIGVAVQEGVAVGAYLASDDQFAEWSGAFLDQQDATVNSQTTNALGLAQFNCWKTARRAAKGGGAATAYTFVIDTGEGALTATVSTIPDRDWVLLKDVVDA